MKTGQSPADSLDVKAVVISPIAAFAGVYVAALIVTSATRLFATIQAETGHAVPVPFGSLIATLNSFGGFIIADASLPVGTLRFTLTAVPFILTALAATILFHANRTSETRRPHWDPADRLLAAACSGMVLLLTCLAAWFVADAIPTPGSEVTSNLFLLAAGSLAFGTVASAAGRESAHRANPAWLFTFRYVLATGLAPAIVLCAVLTVTRDSGASSWLFVGNIAASIWSGIHGGLVHWGIDLGAVGGPQDSGTSLLAALPGEPWGIIGPLLGVVAIIIATAQWRRHSRTVGRWCLPLAFMCASLAVLAAGVWATGSVRVGTDSAPVMAYALSSPLNVPVMGFVGWVIDRAARLSYRSETGVQPQR